jgi:hypothetical protein
MAFALAFATEGASRALMKRTVLLAGIASCGLCLYGCRKPEHTEAAAIEMARQKVLRLSQEIKDHVPINSEKLGVARVEKVERDEGWYVTLSEDGCMYIVYADPGHELDVAGASAGCFATADPK